MRSHSGGAPPTWSSWREIPTVCLCRPHLQQTIMVAAVVGTVLFVINQLDVVLTGQATATTWLKAALTYLVPWCVSNYGIVIASRRLPGDRVAPRSATRRPEQTT